MDEIIHKAPSISEMYFAIDQVRTFVSLISDINTPEVSIAFKNIANHLRNCIFPVIDKVL